MADPVVARLTIAPLEAAAASAQAHAEASAAAGRLEPEVVEALTRAGLFKLHLPADLGGLAAPLPEAVATISRLAEADGATGWAVMIGAGPNAFAGTMRPGLAEEVFGPADSVVAGSGLAGTAAPDGAGGWLVSGRWRWCSGAPWATWFTFAVTAPDGPTFGVAVPADQVRLHPDTWAVRGLAATASWDAELVGVPVPATRTFALGGPALRPEALFQVPFVAFAQCTMAAVSTGLALRLERELVALVAAKPTRDATTVGDDPVVRHRVGRLVAHTRAGAAYLHAAVARLWAEPGDAGAALDVALASTQAVAAGAAAGREAWDLAGMSALPVEAALGRVVADLHAVSQNAVVASARFTDAGGAVVDTGGR